MYYIGSAFAKYRLGNASIRESHRSDMLWAEGPAWSSVGNTLYGAIYPMTAIALDTRDRNVSLENLQAIVMEIHLITEVDNFL